MPRHVVAFRIGPDSRPAAVEDPLSRSVVGLPAVRVEGLVGRILLLGRPDDVDRLVGVDQQVAELALHAAVVGGGEPAPVGRRRAAGEPAADAVAADAEIADAAALRRVGIRQEVLLGDRQRRPEQRVATGVAHHAAFPSPARLPLRVGRPVVATAAGRESRGLERLRAR